MCCSGCVGDTPCRGNQRERGEGETDRHTHTQTETETDTHTDTQRQRERGRQKSRLSVCLLTLLHTHKSEHGTHKYPFYTRFTPEITNVKLQPQAIKHLLDKLGLPKLQSLEL